MANLNAPRGQTPSIQFCCLRFVPDDGNEQLWPDDAQIIFVALKDERRIVEIYVNRDWRRLVQESEHSYISELIDDLKQRLILGPEDLFKQISGLAAGKLVADGVKSGSRDGPPFCDLLVGFNQV